MTLPVNISSVEHEWILAVRAIAGWEAAVGGGIPCIMALKEGLAGNNITYAAGIMNGDTLRR